MRRRKSQLKRQTSRFLKRPSVAEKVSGASRQAVVPAWFYLTVESLA